MLFKSLLTWAVLALSLCADGASAAGHGRFGQRARERYDRAKRATERKSPPPDNQEEDFRFLKDDTKRKPTYWLMSSCGFPTKDAKLLK